MGFTSFIGALLVSLKNLTFNNFNAIGALTNESILMLWFSGEDKYPIYTFTIYGVTSHIIKATFNMSVSKVKDECLGATHNLIEGLEKCFPTYETMIALHMVYPKIGLKISFFFTWMC
jgi:hypothetical protein